MSLPDIKPASYFLKNRKPHPKALIKDYLHVGTKEMLGGGSKSNKTWVQIDRGLSIASGTPWLGMETTQARVLFMNMEVLEPFFMDRIEAVCAAKKIDINDCKIDLWHLRGYTEGYTVFFDKVSKAFASGYYELIITDPIYKVYGDIKENEAGDVAKMLNYIEKFAQERQAAISFSAHYAKGPQHEKYAIDRVSGSGVFARDPDTITSITKHKEPNCSTVDFIMRNCAQKDSIVIEWKYPTMVLRPDLNPKDLHQLAKKGTVGVKPDAVLALLPEDGLTTGAWIEAAGKATGIKERAFYTRRKKLEEDGLIEKLNDRWVPVDVINLSGVSLHDERNGEPQ